MPGEETVEKVTNGLKSAYGLEGPDAVKKFYAGWSDGYEDEVMSNGYVTPERCSRALAGFVQDKSAPVMDLACGTGLSGLALRGQGFSTIDGFDLSPEMLEKARAKTGLYRDLSVCDMSRPFEIPEGMYAHAAAIGCITPDYLPVTVLDEILRMIPSGGYFTFSINDWAARDGTMERHIGEICDCWVAEMVFREYGDHVPGNDMGCTVYVLRKT
ncbi:MAG: methyltransferase domain-containing protein [Pseudomonadota bacterium]